MVVDACCFPVIVSGPALPPGYKRGEPSSSSDESEQEVVVVKRAKTSHTARTNEQEKDDDGFFGPALPPGFKKQQMSPERPPVLGPALPPGFQGFPGPALPPGYQAESSSEDEDVIGPMPSKGPVQDSVALDIERRAQKMKAKLTGDDTPEVVTRETWMTELPPELQHIGLGARTFKKRSGPENKDRSIWTDTPADRERKTRKGEEEKDDVPQLSHKDLEMAEKVSKYNETKRAESLMTLHTKTMKEKAKEKADIPVERRPFDRDADLQVNRFDDAQKERLLKKSQELNTRFSHSKDRMFL
uniref:GPALPP motifs-containing protein 1 n=1 Tax=Dicentrarchus labrax TaxID=13489 RepID=A0A8C4F970_DICLA